MPRFINIRRGGFVCAAVGLAMCPWNLLSSSNNFTTYLSSYSVFLSSIAGVLICDYYVVRKGYLQVKDLYSARRTGPYFYLFGINLRAYGAYIAGILINVVGFAGAIGRNVPVGAQYIYKWVANASLPALSFYEIGRPILTHVLPLLASTSSPGSSCLPRRTGFSTRCFRCQRQVPIGTRSVNRSRKSPSCTKTLRLMTRRVGR